MKLPKKKEMLFRLRQVATLMCLRRALVSKWQHLAHCIDKLRRSATYSALQSLSMYSTKSSLSFVSFQTTFKRQWLCVRKRKNWYSILTWVPWKSIYMWPSRKILALIELSYRCTGMHLMQGLKRSQSPQPRKRRKLKKTKKPNVKVDLKCCANRHQTMRRCLTPVLLSVLLKSKGFRQ